MNKTLNIGEAAKASGVHAKMIRHYEEIGVIPKAMRTDAGYRLYREQDIHTLRFIKNARDLGFSMKEIKKLLSLWKNKSRTSLEVKNLATLHIQALQTKISELKSMVGSLETLIQHCSGDERPECPILKGLGSP